MEFIREPEMLDINGGWCLFINNENCDHSCECEGVKIGCSIEVCGCNNDYSC